MRLFKVAFLAIVLAMPTIVSLTACNTTEGFGQDVQDAGSDLKHEAQKHND
jgi:predicted small secreted protein